MAKLHHLNADYLRVKGLKKRWLIDIIGVVVLGIVIVEILLGIYIHSYYHTSVNENLNLRINSCSDFLREHASDSESQFNAAAKEFIYSYKDKDQVEVQFINSSGKVFASSKGYFDTTQELPDYNTALKDTSQSGTFYGASNTGERIMAKTALMPIYNGNRVGAIRFVVSFEQIWQTIWISIALCALIGAVIIAVTVFTGMMFLKSVLEPIKGITNVAFRIANGNFDDRLPVKDADEIGKLCDTINYMAQELESTDKLKNDFISSVSHELRTPLTVIQGWAETVKCSVGVDDELVEKGVGVITNEVARLSGLVEDLLDFSRMQSGRLSIRKEKCDIIAELQEAVFMYMEEAKKKGVGLEFIAPENLPPVMADASRIKQVFINIIDNAIKYSGNAGTVIVEAKQYDVYVQVTITDMGCGIAAEDLSKVKEKFYKANSTVRGSGIGLAIADEIVKQHEGILLVDSKEGVGTSVMIALPFIKSE